MLINEACIGDNTQWRSHRIRFMHRQMSDVTNWSIVRIDLLLGKLADGTSLQKLIEINIVSLHM